MSLIANGLANLFGEDSDSPAAQRETADNSPGETSRPLGFVVGDDAVIDSPASWFRGLTGKIVSIDKFGAHLTFSKAECAKVLDSRRVIADRPIPFNHGVFVKPGTPLKPAAQPAPTEPDGPLPHEVCGCLVFGSTTCNNCGHCPQCKLQIIGSEYGNHAWRHYVHSSEYREVLEMNARHAQACSQPAPPKQRTEPVPVPAQPKPEPPKTPPAPAPNTGQVSLWD